MFKTLDIFFSFVRSFVRSELNYWTVDSLDFFVLLCSDIEHIVCLHLYITEGKVVAKIDDGYYPSTRQKNAERERKRIPPPRLFRGEEIFLKVLSLFVLSELKIGFNPLFVLKEFITYSGLFVVPILNSTHTRERERKRAKGA